MTEKELTNVASQYGWGEITLEDAVDYSWGDEFNGQTVKSKGRRKDGMTKKDLKSTLESFGWGECSEEEVVDYIWGEEFDRYTVKIKR